MGGTLAGRLYGNLLHDNEMYGTAVIYLRMKGIVHRRAKAAAAGETNGPP